MSWSGQASFKQSSHDANATAIQEMKVTGQDTPEALVAQKAARDAALLLVNEGMGLLHQVNVSVSGHTDDKANSISVQVGWRL